MRKTALIAGATGLVGDELLRQLLADNRYGRVIALSRREIELSHPNFENIVAEFAAIENVLSDVRADDVFCCLGTTMAKAGSRQKFFEVDHAYPLALARITRSLGATQYLLVSALGADPTSTIYYNRVKGEVEKAIQEVGFTTLHIFRPSLLLGPRQESRPGEEAAKKLYRVLAFLIPRKYKGIEARTVAYAMLTAAAAERPGVFIHESGDMQLLQQPAS